MNESIPQPSRDDRIREVVMEFRQRLATGQSCDRESFATRYDDLADELRPILKAIEATEPFIMPLAANRLMAAETDAEQPAGPTVRCQQESEDEPSWSEITRTHAPGSGSSKHGGRLDDRKSLPEGTRIGNYRLLQPLGKGGMGEVYAAEETNTGRRFAVKLLSSLLPRSRDTIERFLNEASLAAKLSHPRTTFVYGAGEENGQFFIAMELMPGHTLRDLVESQGALPVNEAVDYVLDVLDGLEAAHSIGVIHRDLKPSNCFIDQDGRIKVGDFGLAKSLVSNADITQTGTFLGTPQFAAPEQIRRDKIDQRTDIFAVGATLFYLLTGKPPFSGDPAAVIAKIVADSPPDIRKLQPEIPKSLAKVIHRCLSKSPQQRFYSAVELRRALLPFSSDGVSMSDVGRRIAAFVLDLVVLCGITALLGMVFLVTYLVMRASGSSWLPEPLFGFFANVSLVSVPYFAICESIWGSTPGKRWLGIRVADSYGESPTFWQSLLRALIFPGVFFTTIDVAQSLIVNLQLFNDFLEAAVPLKVMREFVVSEGFLFVKVVLAMVCFSTIRRSTGYRGLHEILSGTRVVGIHSVGRRSLFRRLAARWGGSQPMADLPKALGAYDVIGAYGGSSDVYVLEGKDRNLARPVWLYSSKMSLQPGSQHRANVNRPTRQRWLEHGEQQGLHWQAVEAIDGGPMIGLIDAKGVIPWEAGSQLLPDLADELLAALDDGTLPERLSLDQLWLDRGGGLRLVDFPLWRQHPFAESAELSFPAESSDASDIERAWRLLKEVATRCRWDLETPGSAVDYLTELPAKPETQDELRSAARALREFSKIPYQLNWDNRLGMIAVSALVEMSLLMAWIFVATWYSASLMAYNFPATLGLSFIVASILPAILGYVCQGGIAFSLSEFEARSLRTRTASRVRSAVRCVIAWLPFILPIVIVRVLSFVFSPHGKAIVDRSGNDSFAIGLISGLVAMFLAGLAFLGTVFAIVSPRRGLQDWVTRTYIVRR